MNKLSSVTLLGVLFYCSLSLSAQTATLPQLQFIYAPYQEVQAIAHTEGKPYIVFFTASWCMPWQWMEKHTLTDAELVRYTNQHYLSTKVDLDHEKGKAIQARLKVTAIPTILLFNAHGQLLEQIETAIEAQELLGILQQHNIPANRIDNKQAVAADLLPTPVAEVEIERPALVTDSPPPADESPYLEPDISTTYQISNTISEEEDRAVFSIQIGAFSVYDNALSEAEKLKYQVDQNVQLITEERSGSSVFKLFIGRFDTLSAAQSYRAKLKERSIQGFVKKIYI